MAIWLLLLVQLLPVALSARAAGADEADRAGLHAVCSAQGLKWVDADGQLVVDARSGSALAWLDHCPQCVFSGVGAAPAPSIATFTPTVGGDSLPPALRKPEAPRDDPRRRHAPPRAPPQAS